MKKSGLLVLTLLMATAAQAQTRAWKTATIIGSSETSVTGPLVRTTITIHYTVETEAKVLNLDYTYHPSVNPPPPGSHDKHSAPGLAVNTVTRIAISGSHAYIVDSGGNEVKMHIVKKPKR